MVLRAMVLGLVLVGCTGKDTDPTEDSDTGWQGCELAKNADNFTASATAVGGDVKVRVELEAQCTEALGLTFSWRDPRSGAFFLPGTLQADPSLTLEPYDLQTIDVLFRPPSTGSFRDELVVQSDNIRVGGIILTFEGEGL